MDDIVVEPDSSLVIKAAFICLKFSLSLFVKDISLDINFQFFLALSEKKFILAPLLSHVHIFQ